MWIKIIIKIYYLYKIFFFFYSFYKDIRFLIVTGIKYIFVKVTFENNFLTFYRLTHQYQILEFALHASEEGFNITVL